MAAKLDKKNKSTTKLIVWKQPSKKGYPIKVRITKNRKSKYINLKFYLSKSEINKFISQKNEELLPSYPKYEEVMSMYNNILTKIDKKNPQPEVLTDLTFSKYLDKHIEMLEERGKYGYAQKTKSVRYHLNRFTNQSDIKFEDIDIDFLQKFQTYFIKYDVSGITQKGYFDKLRTLLNNAIKEDKYLPKKHPFLAFEPEPYEIIRRNLEKDEFDKINSITKDDYQSKAYIYRLMPKQQEIPENIFVISQKFKFQYFALGMRVSDMILMTWNNIVSRGQRIEYIMFKTKKTINFEIVPELLKILYHFIPEKFIPSTTDKKSIQMAFVRLSNEMPNRYIFNLIPQDVSGKVKYSKMQQATGKYNLELKELQKHLKIKTNITTHTPRHTFAINTIINQELDIYQLSKALNHSSVKTTESYLRGFKSRELDNALKNFYNKYKQSQDQSQVRTRLSIEKLSKSERNKLLQELLNEAFLTENE